MVVGGWSEMTSWSLDWLRFEQQAMKAKIVNDNVVMIRLKNEDEVMYEDMVSSNATYEKQKSHWQRINEARKNLIRLCERSFTRC